MTIRIIQGNFRASAPLNLGVAWSARYKEQLGVATAARAAGLDR